MAGELRRARLAVTLAFCAQGISFAALVTRIPALQQRFGLSETALAALLAVVPVIAGVGSVTAGALAARRTSRRVLRVAGPGVPLAVLAVGAAPDLPVLMLALAAVGITLGAVDATVNVQGVGVEAGYRRPVMASFYAAFSVAGIAGALLASAAAQLGVPLVVFFGALCLLVVPVQLWSGGSLLSQDLDQGAVGDTGPDDRAPLPWRGVLLLGVMLASVYLLDSSVSNWSALYITQVLSGSQSVAALAFGAYALTTALARTGVDRAAAAVGPVRLARGGAAVALLGLVVIVAAPSAPVALAGFALLGLGVAPAMPLIFSAAAQLREGTTDRVVAWVNVFNYLGVILGAPLVGLVGGASSLRWGIAALLPVALLVLLLVRVLAPAPRGDHALRDLSAVAANTDPGPRPA